MDGALGFVAAEGDLDEVAGFGFGSALKLLFDRKNVGSVAFGLERETEGNTVKGAGDGDF
jgi:hypothetical protein